MSRLCTGSHGRILQVAWIDIGPGGLTLIQHNPTIGGIFVCAFWGLLITDRVISVVAGPDGISPIPDSARSGLRNGWTCGALRSRATYRCAQADRSPYSSTYGGISSYTSSPAGSPMHPYSPYSLATVSLPLSGLTPTPEDSRAPCRGPGSPRPICARSAKRYQRRWVVHAGDDGDNTGLASGGTRYTSL